MSGSGIRIRIEILGWIRIKRMRIRNTVMNRPGYIEGALTGTRRQTRDRRTGLCTYTIGDGELDQRH